MFQVEPILWLQSFDSGEVGWLLSTVSLLGYTPVYTALIVVLAFGHSLRPSLAVLVALLLSGILTDGLKNGLGLPRPGDVDARVVERGSQGSNPIFDSGGAESFWALPSPAAIVAVRAQPEVSHGLPSEHVSSTAAFFLALAFFYRSRGSFLFAVGWIPLMGLSRMYLGRHFLADIFAGLAVGAFAVAVAAGLLRRFRSDRSSEMTWSALLPLAGVSLVLLSLTPFVTLLDGENVGRLLGVLAAYVLVLARALAGDEATVGQRFARVMTAFVVSVIATTAVGACLDAFGLEDARLGALAAGFLITSLTLAGTIEICRRFRWYGVA